MWTSIEFSLKKKCMDFIKEVQLLEAEAAMDIRKGE
jgi:hypothetical protein